MSHKSRGQVERKRDAGIQAVFLTRRIIQGESMTKAKEVTLPKYERICREGS